MNNKIFNEKVTLDISCIQQKYLYYHAALIIIPTLNRPVHQKLLILGKSYTYLLYTVVES